MFKFNFQCSARLYHKLVHTILTIKLCFGFNKTHPTYSNYDSNRHPAFRQHLEIVASYFAVLACHLKTRKICFEKETRPEVHNKLSHERENSYYVRGGSIFVCKLQGSLSCTNQTFGSEASSSRGEWEVSLTKTHPFVVELWDPSFLPFVD